jgi:O-antigen biosynthesis protein WbqP
MYVRIKRVADACVAAIFLVLLIIPGVFIALIIRLDSKGPVIFKQQRSGKDREPFTIYKFRTMTTEAPKDCATNDLKDSASYITTIGKVMRKLSIDELPQLVNVLKGDMSIVGPRPVILNEVELLEERDRYSANTCRPGITGWAQANGRDEVDIYEKARMDGEYRDRFGVLMDFYCLVKTGETMIFAKGFKEGPRTNPVGNYAYNSNTANQNSISVSPYANVSTIQ